VWRHLCSLDIILVSYCFLMFSFCVYVFSSDESRKCTTVYAWIGLVLLVLDLVLAIFVSIVSVIFKGNTFTFLIYTLAVDDDNNVFTLVNYWYYNQLWTNVVPCQYLLTSLQKRFVCIIPYGWKYIHLKEFLQWPV